ncbi:MAG: sigma-70 family RNA polymerase sigma factor [Bacteroidetes bacterium]|jgi:RNA polymerase sigma factor (sigma-70 family)|nr:sigma-70 family RNA polymerase sigma factor [Bacteroidota bacterium]MBT4967437.1 sigma-70 family RNA polymerase sigma factor [Bacteroidota bacterium]
MQGDELIQKIKSGDEKVLQDFYKKFRNHFISYAYKRYKLDIEILKEVYQDAVLAFRNNIVDEKLTVLTCKPKTYLFQIGNNLIGKELRKRKSEVPMPDYIERTCYDKEADLFSKMNLTEVQSIIKKEMQKLGDKCFKILHLFYFEKMRMEMIAEQLNYGSVDSAKSTKHQCFQKLKNSITEKYDKSTFTL